jgi:polysaccharide biosynthesis transport protein
MSQSLPWSAEPHTEALHLREYWHVLLRRRWLALGVLLLVVTGGLLRILLLRPSYEATAHILIEKEIPSVLDFEKNPRVGEAWEDFYQTQYRLLQSRLIARKVVERLKLLQDPEFYGPRPLAEIEAAESAPPGGSQAMEDAIDRFLSQLSVQPVKNSQMVAIAFHSLRPDLAARVANAVAEAYIQQTLEFRYRTSAEAGTWLGNETAEQSRKVDAAEKALHKFQEEEGLVNIEERRTLLEQKLKDLGSALTVAKTRRLEKEALHQEMRTARSAMELPDVIKSPLIQGLQTELASLERQQQQLGQRYLEDHPEMVRIRQQIEGTRAKIEAEARRIVRAAENDYEAAAAQEHSVAGALQAAQTEAADLEHRGLKYDALKRDLEASQKVSDSILARQKQTDAVRDMQASTVHVVDAAVAPRVPVRPRPLRDLLLSLFLGLGGGVAAAFLRDYLDDSVAKPSDVRVLGLPLLGVVPEAKIQRKTLLPAKGQETFHEGYRVVRSALPPVEPGRGQVLLVTSTLAGEGKTLTSANLALALASAGERVLLVDADLQRPTLSMLFRTTPGRGLCEVLSGRCRPLQAIFRVPGKNLSVLAAGTAPRGNPSDLLATGALRELLSSLRGQYDHIVVDTPPAGALATALVLSPLADGVVVVARCGKVTTTGLAQVLERLAQARAQVLGVVLNRARPDRNLYDYGAAFDVGAFAMRPYRALPAGSPTEATRAVRRPY